MISRVFSVYDSAARSYSQPFYAAGRSVAFRMFEKLVNDGQSTVSQWPKDFSLFELGSFNDETAVFIFLDAPERVCDAMSLVRPVSVPSASSVLPLRTLSHADEPSASL